jgi:Mg2+ and Co2+ transporter CorA
VTSWDRGNDSIKTLSFEDSQKLQTIQERITDMFAMLDSTTDITSSLEEKYYIFHLGLDTVIQSRIRYDPIAFAFHEKIQELKFMRQKLENLHRSIEATVQFASSLLDLENGQSLRGLAEEARREGKVMHSLTEKATQDAAAVKVITVITMIYLPLTVVANFFSTVFVTRTSDGPTNTIQVANNWWILAAVGIPLTGVTFFMWWAISQRMFLLDALGELKTRSMKHLSVLASRSGSKESVCDQESLAGLEIASGAVIT